MDIATMPFDSLCESGLWQVLLSFASYDQWFIIVGFYAMMDIATKPCDSLYEFGLWRILPSFASYDQWFIIVGF